MTPTKWLTAWLPMRDGWAWRHDARTKGADTDVEDCNRFGLDWSGFGLRRWRNDPCVILWHGSGGAKEEAATSDNLSAPHLSGPECKTPVSFVAYKRIPCQRPRNRAADAMLVGIENFPRLGYIYRSDGAASEVKRCLGSLNFSQARHWFSVSLPSRRAARKRAGTAAGTAVGVAVGAVSAGARLSALAGVIPTHTTLDRTITRRPTMRARLAAGRTCACGETDIGHSGGPGAAGDRSSFFVSLNKMPR